MSALTNYRRIFLCVETQMLVPHRMKGQQQHTVDVEGDGGALAHRHCRVAGHAGKVATAVSVGWRDGQVAPGGHPLPVRQHFLLGKREMVGSWLWVGKRVGGI